MSARAESCHQNISVQERPPCGDSGRVAGRDGSERNRRLGCREPRLALSELPPTSSRDGCCHTDLRARGLLRAAFGGFPSYLKRRRLRFRPPPREGWRLEFESE